MTRRTEDFLALSLPDAPSFALPPGFAVPKTPVPIRITLPPEDRGEMLRVRVLRDIDWARDLTPIEKMRVGDQIIEAESMQFRKSDWPMIQSIIVCAGISGATIDIDTIVRDREDGVSGVPIRFSQMVSYVELRHRKLIQSIRRTLLGWLEHEMNECLYVDGVRRWDPHARDVKGILYDL